MNQFVTDTHALLWHLSNDPSLSIAARDVFLSADAGQADIFIPSIVLVEVVYLTERQRIAHDLIDRIIAQPIQFIHQRINRPVSRRDLSLVNFAVRVGLCGGFAFMQVEAQRSDTLVLS